MVTGPEVRSKGPCRASALALDVVMISYSSKKPLPSEKFVSASSGVSAEERGTVIVCMYRCFFVHSRCRCC